MKNKLKLSCLLIVFILAIISIILLFTSTNISKARYTFHLFYGFAGGIITYFMIFFFGRLKLLYEFNLDEYFERPNPKWEFIQYLFAFFIIVGFDIWWQFFVKYNSDSSLQITFTLLGILFFPKFVEWFWDKS